MSPSPVDIRELHRKLIGYFPEPSDETRIRRILAELPSASANSVAFVSELIVRHHSNATVVADVDHIAGRLVRDLNEHWEAHEANLDNLIQAAAEHGAATAEKSARRQVEQTVIGVLKKYEAERTAPDVWQTRWVTLLALTVWSTLVFALGLFAMTSAMQRGWVSPPQLSVGDAQLLAWARRFDTHDKVLAANWAAFEIEQPSQIAQAQWLFDEIDKRGDPRSELEWLRSPDGRAARELVHFNGPTVLSNLARCRNQMSERGIGPNTRRPICRSTIFIGD